MSPRAPRGAHRVSRPAPAGSGPSGRISRDDIEAQIRRITGQVDRTVERTTEAVKPKLMPLGVAGGLVVVTLVYLLGRRRGRRKSTVVEIRRV